MSLRHVALAGLVLLGGRFSTGAGENGQSDERNGAILRIQRQINTSLPSANVKVRPASPNAIVLDGLMKHADDTELVMKLAHRQRGDYRGVFVNRLRTQRVQVDMVVADVISMKVAPLQVADRSRSEKYLSLLTLLENACLGKIRARLKLVTTNGRAAYFRDGGTLHLPDSANGEPVAVNFGTMCCVTPTIEKDGAYLEIELDQSEVDEKSTTVPCLARNQVRTCFFLKEGQSALVVLPNCYRDDYLSPVFFLRGLPIIGPMLQEGLRPRQPEKKDLVVIVTVPQKETE